MATSPGLPSWENGSSEPIQIGNASLHLGCCIETMARLEAESVDSYVGDAPYHLTPPRGSSQRGFMGEAWDGGDIAFRPETWASVYRVLKPGAHLVAFGGTRTYHRMVCAIEDAGLEIRDQLAWVYGSGFPKSHDAERGLAAATCRLAGRHFKRRLPEESKRRFEDHICPATERSEPWAGWGTALKPAWEPICLARKPLVGTVANNVLAHGTGAINIDECRIETSLGDYADGGQNSTVANRLAAASVTTRTEQHPLGRWPANIIHDGSEEVLAHFPETGSSSGHVRRNGDFKGVAKGADYAHISTGPADSGSAARFFYCAKTSAAERHAGCDELEKGNGHPTVKPVDLMRYLTRLVTPMGGLVLDPFAGSGSTLVAASWEGFRSIGCDLSPGYLDIAKRRLIAAQNEIGRRERQSLLKCVLRGR